MFGEDASNNILEFLALAINIWLACLESKAQDCILALGDNTSALGWVYRSGRLTRTSTYFFAAQKIAKKIAEVTMEHEVCLCTQHLKGVHNDVADLLSFEGSHRGYPHPLALDLPNDAELTQRFHSYLPQLIPHNFEISDLPPDVLSWATLVLRTYELSLIRAKSSLTKSDDRSWRRWQALLQRPRPI